MQADTIEGSLKEHVNRRVEHLYPDAEYGKDGAVLPEIFKIVSEQGEKEVRQDTESMFDLKQTAMPELPASESLLFEDMRPRSSQTRGALLIHSMTMWWQSMR